MEFPSSFSNISLKTGVFFCVVCLTVFENEAFPTEWSTVSLSMVHKKGPIDNPSNYRGIACINTVIKLFNMIMLNRLNSWVESNNILPEIQAGFRKNRSCMDNIFVLNSTIQTHLRRKGRRVFAAFDLKRAFDSINHPLLWQKLFKLGISSKFIRLVRALYDKSSFCVKVNNEYSKFFAINEGVLQGELLSPLLFSLFIADIDDFFRKSDMVGINIDNRNDLLLLLYADDLVILADSEIDLARKLRTLEQYTCLNKLTVNNSKSKIMCFSRGGHKITRNYKFLFNKVEIEMTNHYTYLGVTLTCSSLFREHAMNTSSKCKQAIGAVMNMLSRSKTTSWQSRIALYHSIVINTLANSVPVWGLRYLNIVEKTQVGFFKRLLLLPLNTPDYLVRLEVGVVRLDYTVFKLCLNWLLKMFSFANTRLPKIVFLRLLELEDFDSPCYNWALQMKLIFIDLGLNDVWNNLSFGSLKSHYDAILENFKQKLYSSDLQRLANSNYCVIYKHLTVTSGPANYLTSKLPIKLVRIFCQIRLCSKTFVRITYKGSIYTINQEEICTLCNSRQNETLEHIVLQCRMYDCIRVQIIKNLHNFDDFIALLNTASLADIKQISNYFIGALKIRSFIINE